MKTKVIFTFLLLYVSTSVISLKAQNNGDNTKKKDKIAGLSISLGGGVTTFSPNSLTLLNQRLQKNNYALIPNQFATWNLDLLHGIYKNTVFNLGFNGIMNRNTVSDSSKTSTSGFAINFAVGKVLCHTDNLLIYPMIGGNFGSIDIHSHYTGFNKASDISGTNKRNALDFSLNFDYLFNGMSDTFDTPQGTGILSLSVGYVFSPVSTYWNDNNYDISSRFNANVNYPANVIGSLTSSNMSMFYVTLKFGFGAFSRKG